MNRDGMRFPSRDVKIFVFNFHAKPSIADLVAAEGRHGEYDD